MPRSRTLLACALSASVASWSYTAAAQTEGAPVPLQPEPPGAPMPAEPAPPEPPAAPPETAPPPVAPTEPPAAPAPAPPPAAPPSAPPSGAFPLPAETPPSPKKPKPQSRAEPPPTAEPAPFAPSRPDLTSEPAPAQKPSDGLFQAKPADGVAPAADDKDEGTDQFKIGPVAGVGIPSVISFGGTLKLTRFLGAGANIGLIPKVQLSYYGDATLSYQHYDIYARLYPFGGGFFLSGGLGYATVEGTLSSRKVGTYSGFTGTVDYNSKGSVRTPMLTALIGYFYTTSIGFSFGVDAGAQIPVAPSKVSYGSEYEITTNAPSQVAELAKAQFRAQADDIKQKSDKSVTDTLEKIGRTTLPTLNLRIGWIL